MAPARSTVAALSYAAPVLVALLGPLLAVIPPATAAPTCGGKPATLVFGPGDDDVTGTPGDDVVVLGDGDDYYRPDPGGNDIVCGGRGNDDIRTGAGDDVVYAGPGNDLVSNGTGRNVTFGGSGIDTIAFDVTVGVQVDLVKRRATGGATDRWTSIETFNGSQGDDTVRGTSGRDVFLGFEGNDVIRAGRGRDVISAGGDSRIYGGPGADLLQAAGTTVVRGGPGSDRLEAVAGSPDLVGGAGNDFLSLRTGAQPNLRGLLGENTLSLAFLGGPVTLDLKTGVGGYGGLSFNVSDIGLVVGTPYADVLAGSFAAEELRGGPGADTLLGRGGDDVLRGGADVDTADGGGGRDRCSAEIVIDC